MRPGNCLGLIYNSYAEDASSRHFLTFENSNWNRQSAATVTEWKDQQWRTNSNVVTSSLALFISLLLMLCSSSSRSLRNSSSKSETRVLSLSLRISSETLPSRSISFSLHNITISATILHCVLKKNTHSHFLSYLHELFVDLNKNCSEYTQGLIDSDNVKIRYS